MPKSKIACISTLLILTCLILPGSFMSTAEAQDDYSLSTDQNYVNPGDSITVAWTRPSGAVARRGFVGLYDHPAADGWSYIDYRYPTNPNQRSGTLTFIAPSSPGTYWLGWVDVGVRTSTSFTVAGALPIPDIPIDPALPVVPVAPVAPGVPGLSYSLSANPNPVSAGEVFTVAWTKPPTAGEGFIGLYASTATDGWGYIDHVYPTTSGDQGTVTLRAPSSPGAYWIGWVDDRIRATIPFFVGIAPPVSIIPEIPGSPPQSAPPPQPPQPPSTPGSSYLPRLSVSSSGRFLTQSDGTPFFWMGDTAWFLPMLSIYERDMYLADAAQKGFNGIWVDLTTYGFIPVGENPFFNDDTDTPNENYWSQVDALISAADSYGIYTGLVISWPYHVAYLNNSLEKVNALGRWLGQRYGSRNNVVWVVSGEYPSLAGYCGGCISSYEKDKYEYMAWGIRNGGGSQLMTIHPGGGHSSLMDFSNSSWLDFTILQSGHYRNSETYGLPEIHDLITGEYNAYPVRPTMDGEPNYEGLPNGWYEDRDVNAAPISDADVRRKAYWSVFAGAFGHVYGSESIEVFHRQGDDFGHYAASPLRYLLSDWQTALNIPGRTQMRHLRSLIESRPLLERVPDQTLLASYAETGLNHVQATRGSDGSYAWVYIPTGGIVTINMSILAGPVVNASWYSPRDGSYTAIGQYSNSNTRSFNGPGATATGNDWVLVLDSTGN